MKGIKFSLRSFLDLLFNCLLAFVFLLIVTFWMIKIDKRKANITTHAEYVITVTWDLDNPDDVDSWTRDPLGNLVWFRKKENGLCHLDRDDLGRANDTFTLPDGTTIRYPYNQEITTIRGFIPGVWVFNVHLYNKNKRDGPANVEVKMEKLNPNMKTIFIKRFTLIAKGDEYTVARFEMAVTGEVLWMDEAYVPLFQQKLIDESHDIGG